jgi:hypothetical protein
MAGQIHMNSNWMGCLGLVTSPRAARNEMKNITGRQSRSISFYPPLFHDVVIVVVAAPILGHPMVY